MVKKKEKGPPGKRSCSWMSELVKKSSLERNFIGEESHPEDTYSESGDQGKECDCSPIPRVGVGVCKWVKDDQRQPGDGKNRCPAQFGSFRAGAIEQVVEEEYEQADDDDRELEVQSFIDPTDDAKVNHKRFGDK